MTQIREERKGIMAKSSTQSEKKTRPQHLTVVTGVIGSDGHSIGSWLVAHTLSEAGVKVVRLGSMVQQADFVKAAVETNADALFVTSVYGQGYLDCQGLRQKCDEAGLKDILIYLGGQLVVGSEDWPSVEEKFKAIGINRVYPPRTLPTTAIAHLMEDLAMA
jgi:methylaspartate mutase sigma subunit